MTIRSIQIVLLCLIALLATACSQPTPDPDATSPVPRPSPTPTPPAETAAQPAVVFTSGGQNDNGTFYRGAPDAPVTLIDYSDFL